MEILKAEEKNIPEIMLLIREAQQFLKKEGINQWQNNYPNQASLKKDIKAGNFYIIKVEAEIIAAAAIIFGEDPTYSYIESGQWLSSNSYGVIHRAVVKASYRGKGIAAKIFDFTYKIAFEKNVGSIRIDTHRDNIPMQRVIEKEGFKYCGIIYTEAGSERYAYEKIL